MNKPRVRIRAKKSKIKSPTILRENCGTTSGHTSHYYRNEIVCEPCRIAYSECNKEKYARHAERIAKRDKIKRDADPEKYRTRGRLFIKNNPEKKCLASKMDYERNKEKRQLAHKIWHVANPEKAKIHAARRRALKTNAPTEPYTTQQILEIYGTDCHLCHEPIDLEASRHVGSKGWENGLHLDHVIPLSKSGTDLISNVKPSHGLCNMQKRAS